MTSNKIVEIIKERSNHLNNDADPKYKLGYDTALKDILRDINTAVELERNGNMVELGERNFTILEEGIKMTGSYDPNELLPYIEERLFIHESDTIVEFLQWVVDGGEMELASKLKVPKRGFGRSNYEERFQEFLKERGK